MSKHLLVGCSFTDPMWQEDVPWSVEFSKTHPSYIVAKAGMGIKGITTEAMYYLKGIPDISTCVIMLPSLWRMDIEMSQDSEVCNAMVDLLECGVGGCRNKERATRKWIVSGGVHYDKKTKAGKIFNPMYKHQGFLVILKEHIRSLKILIDYCRRSSINYYISAITDPMEQLLHCDMRGEETKLLEEVEYSNWFRFDGKFVNRFLSHDKHPSTEEHVILSEYIIRNIL
jgi:hypothetical protein